MKVERWACSSAVLLLGLLLPPAWAAPPAGITLIADTQEHENKGNPDAGLSFSAAAFVRVTLRPAQQTLFAKEVLRDVITRSDDPAPIVHLGDALDLSCRDEWLRFMDVMTSTTRPWVLMPGNHDGFAFGNQLPVGTKLEKSVTGVSRPGWNNLCDRGRYYGDREARSFDKNAFVVEYVASVQRRFPAFAATDFGKPDGWSCPQQADFLRCIAWSISGDEPWRSYVVQTVDVPQANPVDKALHLILLDTSQYAQSPRWAGKHGSVLPSQLDAARRMITALRERSQSAFALAGHHQLREWVDESRAALQALVDDTGAFPFYVSAHTHRGHWQSVDLTAKFAMHELNVGSLNDAPVHYRTLDAKVGDARLELSSRSVLLAASAQADGACSGITLPSKDRVNSIEFQRPPSWLGAIVQYPAYWRAKRRELAPELFIYDELIERFVRADAGVLTYSWESGQQPQPLATRQEVLNEARTLQRVWKNKDWARRIARFLMVADDYLTANAADRSALRRHVACLSLAAAVRDAEVDGVDLQPTMRSLQIRDYAVALDGSGGPLTVER